MNRILTVEILLAGGPSHSQWSLGVLDIEAEPLRGPLSNAIELLNDGIERTGVALQRSDLNELSRFIAMEYMRELQIQLRLAVTETVPVGQVFGSIARRFGLSQEVVDLLLADRDMEDFLLMTEHYGRQIVREGESSRVSFAEERWRGFSEALTDPDLLTPESLTRVISQGLRRHYRRGR